MSPLSRFLDAVNPIEDPSESWRDKDWRRLYCLHCGAESEYVKEIGAGVVWLTCPDCEREPVPGLKPGFDFVWFAVLAVVIAAPFATYFDLTVGVIAFMATVWAIHNRTEAVLGAILGEPP